MGILVANKPIELSLLKELWADAVATIDHNLVVRLDIKDEGASSKLIVAAFKEHSRKGRYVKRALAQDSKQRDELVALISEIKKLSEY